MGTRLWLAVLLSWVLAFCAARGDVGEDDVESTSLKCKCGKGGKGRRGPGNPGGYGRGGPRNGFGPGPPGGGNGQFAGPGQGFGPGMPQGGPMFPGSGNGRPMMGPGGHGIAAGLGTPVPLSGRQPGMP